MIIGQEMSSLSVITTGGVSGNFTCVTYLRMLIIEVRFHVLSGLIARAGAETSIKENSYMLHIPHTLFKTRGLFFVAMTFAIAGLFLAQPILALAANATGWQIVPSPNRSIKSFS